MTIANNLGVVSAGIINLANSSVFTSIPDNGVGSSLISTGPNTYSFVPFVATSSSSIVSQIVMDNSSNLNVSPFVTGNQSVYNAAADFLNFTVTPTSADSVFTVGFSCTASMVSSASGNIIYCTSFLNAGGPRLAFDQVDMGGAGLAFTTHMGADLQFSTGSLTPFTMNFCLFLTSAASSTAIEEGDFFYVNEAVPTIFLPTKPTFESLSATPVLVQFIPTGLINTSQLITGVVWAVDSSNINSNSITYSFVMQQPGNPASVSPTIAQNTVQYNAVQSTSSLTFVTALGGVNVFFNGINGTSFNGQTSFKVVATS